LSYTHAAVCKRKAFAKKEPHQVTVSLSAMDASDFLNQRALPVSI